MSMPIILETAIKEACPDLRLGLLQASIVNGETSVDLTHEIATKGADIVTALDGEAASTRPEIAAIRRFYKALGKDPSRYRPSAEALTRRMIQGKGLYSVSNAVDVTNLISVASGLSIGAYDTTKIDGPVTLRPGEEGEPYEAIGRGALNIANLPMFTDDQGPFGSPTSDSLRTCLEMETTELVMVLISCDGATDLDHWLAETGSALKRYCQASALDTDILTAKDA